MAKVSGRVYKLRLGKRDFNGVLIMGKTLFYMSPSRDGYRNLAVDEWLLDTLGVDDMALYFYINANAVIIGKNQNPFRECNLRKMEQDDVQLVRRITGGGAVYHDEGNLNFSFICGNNRYDESSQFELILNAVRSLGIPCEFSGKNDLKANGMKFSGNAFCARNNTRQHHGTLLVNADLKKLSDYLNPDPKKMKAKGVTSVRQKVCNLCDFIPSLKTEDVARAVRKAYEAAYGGVEEFSPSKSDEAQIKKYYEKQTSWEWKMGNTPQFDFELDERFDWGSVQLYLNVEKNIINGAKLYSDANDAQIADNVKELLIGTRFSARDVADALLSKKDIHLTQLAEYILEKGI